MMRPHAYVFRGQCMPKRTADGIEAYVETRAHPGSFLEAVLCNDLREAFAQADDVNFYSVHVVVAYLYNQAPATCWGSRKAFEAWMAEAPTEGQP